MDIEWFVALAGTQEGEQLALGIAIFSAVTHAIFGAICKSRGDPYFNRAAANIVYSLTSMPIILFVLPFPTRDVAVVLAISFMIHLSYEWFQSAAFSRGAFTLVYPIARGMGPAMTGVFAVMVFGEYLDPVQWFGLVLLSGSIVSLGFVMASDIAADNPARRGLWIAAILAAFTGVNTAIYTIVDAYGIRITENPLTYVFWIFFLGGFGFPVVVAVRWYRLAERPALKPYAIRGFFAGLIGIATFGSMMMATRIGKVAEVAAIRETSIIFATAIGYFFFRETLDAKRLFVIMLIAFGAILIEYH